MLAATLGCGGGTATDDGGAVEDGAVDGGSVDARTDAEGIGVCVSDDQCDDGLSCTGTERCLPDDPRADMNGCVTSGAPGGRCPPCDEGYRVVDRSCLNIDECAEGDPCGDPMVVRACMDFPGSFRCSCISGFVATAVGQRCLYADPSLTSLEPSEGTLSPTFAPDTLTYRLTLPPGQPSATFTPSVAYAERATIRVADMVVASGASSPSLRSLGFAPRPVTIRVMTESGATRDYTVVLTRSSSYIKASNTDAEDRFGVATALSADGSTLAVGAPDEASAAQSIGGDQADNGATQSGAVYVFTRSGVGWTHQAYIKTSNAAAYAHFGSSLALSDDGSTLAVGAYSEQPATRRTGEGAAYVFTRAGTIWSEQAFLKASNVDLRDNFGRRVALAADGSTLAVGAPQESSNARGVDGDQADDSAYRAGAVYVFTRTGGVWTQQAYIKASNADAGDYFGGALTLSADGSSLAVGATQEESSAVGVDGDESDNSVTGAGAVYVFTRTGAVWSQQAYIKASNTGSTDNFGYALTLSSDGSALAVGAPNEDSSATGIDRDQGDGLPDAGAVYVFARTDSGWAQRAYVKASNTGRFDHFGWVLGLSADGATLAVGAAEERSNAVGINGDEADDSGSQNGAVYIFARTDSGWAQQAYVKASNTGEVDRFGWSLALSADASTLAIGAPYEDSSATGVEGDQTDEGAVDSGGMYVF